jgi:hypothetical protein
MSVEAGHSAASKSSDVIVPTLYSITDFIITGHPRMFAHKCLHFTFFAYVHENFQHQHTGKGDGR